MFFAFSFSFFGYAMHVITRKIDNLARLFSFYHVLLTWLFHGLASSESLTKSVDFSF